MNRLAVVGLGAACLLTALAISGLLTPLVRRWALERDFVDRPGAGSHKKHDRVTALGGGIAITVAILIPMIAAMLAAKLLLRADPGSLGWLTDLVPSWRAYASGMVDKIPQGLAIMAGALAMHLMGIIDDHRPLSPFLKLAVQAAVVLGLAAGVGVRAAEALGPAPAVLLTTLWMVALINSFNFMDNMDGLTAGVAGLTATALAISALMAGQVFVPCLALIVAGAVLGFLIHNFPPAKIFMGDAGSLVVGFMLAVCSVLTTFYDPGQWRKPVGVLVPLLVFAMPLYDTASVIIHRLRVGASIFQADRRHFSHRLVALGNSPRTAVLTIYLATAATAAPAVLLPTLNWAAATLIFIQCLCVLAIIAILEARHD